MPTQKNPSNNNVLLLAAGGFALYYFWPQISAAMAGSSAASGGTISYPASDSGFTTQEPNLTDAQLAALLALENAGYPGGAGTAAAAATAATASGATATSTPGLQPAFPGAVVPPGTVYTPGQPLPPGVSLPGNAVNILTPQPLTNANIPNTGPSVGFRALNPGVDPSIFIPRAIAPLQPTPLPTAQSTGSGPTIRTAPTALAGTRRLRGAVSPEAKRAAALVVAHLNNSVTYDAPQVTNDSPVGPWTPGASQLPGGCWQYGDTPVLMNCRPGAVPASPSPEATGVCMPGYTMSDTGQCAKTDDQIILAQLNSTPYVSGAVSLNGISSAILGLYVSTIGVNPGSQLAAYLGLPSNQAFGTFAPGNDGFNYLMLQGIFLRQGTQTQLTRPTGPIGPRPGPLPAGTKLKGILPTAVPITNATLVAASSDPKIAATLGNDPRAMLTVQQWNYYYTQSTGVLQIAPPYPATDPNALITATQYQQWRIAAGLTPAPPKKGKLGVILTSRPGAFPLGGISNGPMRVPFVTPGNNNIYRIPGRGAVYAAKRLGIILDGGGDHRWAQSPFPRAAGWRRAG